MAASRRTTKAPLQPWSRRAGSRSAHALGIEDSTAPIAAERQSFLDNVIAQFDGVWAWNDRCGPNAGQKESFCDDVSEFESCMPSHAVRRSMLRGRAAANIQPLLLGGY